MINAPTTPCVYAITNLVDGKRYIGSTRNFKTRRREHIKRLRIGDHPNRHLQNAWNKYGEGSFIFWIVSVVEDIKFLISREQAWMDGFKPEYNIRLKADSCLGVKRSAETCEKISRAKMGHSPSPEARRKMSEAGKRRDFSLETERNRKIGVALKGRVVSEDTRIKMSISRMGVSPVITPERNAKISMALKGRPLSAEHRAKLRQPKSKETKLKLSIAAMKRVCTPLRRESCVIAASKRNRNALGMFA